MVDPLALTLSALLVWSSPAARERPTGASHYVSPSGTAAGDGSLARPWDLATALASRRVLPGDTIWLGGGTYRGAFRSTVRGAPGAPVVVRQRPGERAVIEGAGATPATRRGDLFVVAGDYTVLWGFELTDSDPDRTSEARPNMVVNAASHTRYVNLVIHDGGIGFYTYAEPTDVEVSGCIFYNNGWDAPTRGGGHAIYAKSNTGPLVLRDNVAFNQFGYGLHVYTEARSGLLNNIRLEGNVAFNNGSISAKPAASNILVGGQAPADAIVARDNMTYYSPGVEQVNARFGWRNARVQNGTLTLTGNYFVGGRVVLDLHAWRRADARDNVLSGPEAAPLAQLDDPPPRLRDANAILERAPAEPRVFVRPSRDEPGRATIVVYNWSGQASVPVDLAGVLTRGDRYEVRNVQDLYGAPVAAGAYTGIPISVPGTGVRPPEPVGGARRPPPRTGPAFDVFVVTRRTN